MRSLLLTIFLSFSIVIFGEKIRYDNYRIYSIKVENEKQLKLLQDLNHFRNGILFMEAPISLHRTIDIVVPPHKCTNISDLFETYEIKNEIKIENLQT